MDPGTGSGSFWLSPASYGTANVTASTPGAYASGSGTPMNGVADFARWRTSSSLNGIVQLEIILYLYDT